MPMKTAPLISIITPSYNSSEFIAETISSILNQSFTDWELLITDDCSSDDSYELLQSHANKDSRIKVFQLTENGGAGAARNNSIKQASGRYIAFCDSDDQWKPDKLEKQLKFMQDNDCALSYSSYDVIDEDGTSKGFVDCPTEVTYRRMLSNNYIGCLTVMYDTEKLSKMYMPLIRKRQDWALWLDILKKVPKAYGIDERLSIYRDRSNSISSNKMNLIKYNWMLYHDVEKLGTIRSAYQIFEFMFFYFLKKVRK